MSTLVDQARQQLMLTAQWLENGCDPKHAATELRMLADRVQELEGRSPPSSVQPEKERRPIAEHELRGQIENYAPQSDDEEIGFRDGWRSSERFHGISPSPSMVGREDTPHE